MATTIRILTLLSPEPTPFYIFTSALSRAAMADSSHVVPAAVRGLRQLDVCLFHTLPKRLQTVAY